MTIRRTIFLILLCIGAFTACEKVDMPQPKIEYKLFNCLTGNLAFKKWKLSAIYIDGVKLSLNTAQQAYGKTFTKLKEVPPTASFSDTDGYSGTVVILSETQIEEVIENNILGKLRKLYAVNSLTEKILDIAYTYNGQTIREVYDAN